MTPITDVTLEPKDGYVEVEVSGVRQYKKVPSETDALALQLQLAIAELAEAQEAQRLADKLEMQLAIAEAAEAILGGEA